MSEFEVIELATPWSDCQVVEDKNSPKDHDFGKGLAR